MQRMWIGRSAQPLRYSCLLRSPPRHRALIKHSATWSAPYSKMILSAQVKATNISPQYVNERIRHSVIAAGEDPAHVDATYRPYVQTGASPEADWTSDAVFAEGEAGLKTAATMSLALPRPIRVLVLYGSLRER